MAQFSSDPIAIEPAVISEDVERRSLSPVLRNPPRVLLTRSVTVVGATLLLGAIFKLSAFGREAFITSRFGLSSVTDAYFALQQLPVTAAAYMFGPFARAFTPAYAESYKKDGRVEWFGGLVFYGVLIAVVLTLISFAFSSQILTLLTRSNSWSTLAVLSICYLPILFIGFRAATWTSFGRNLRSLTVAGLPYLVMTLVLIGMYFVHAMGNLSLALSMSAGFIGVGLMSLAWVFWSEKPLQNSENFLRPWKFPAFRRFTSQLTASSVETTGSFINHFMMLYFMARAGTGAISANNCATRIGMLGYSLFAQPLLQLLQARLCSSAKGDEQKIARRYTASLAVGASVFAIGIFLFRYPIVSLVYKRGNFTSAELEAVIAILPAWLCYFVVLSLNTIISQYMFHQSLGYKFTRNMLAGYTGTNILRFATAHSMGAAWIIWCAVISEGTAFLVNCLTSITAAGWSPFRRPVVCEEA